MPQTNQPGVHLATPQIVLAVALLAAAAAAPARAETAAAPPTLVQPEALPFTDADLQQALQARVLPPPGEPGEPELPQAAVEPAGEGAVTVRVGARTRVVTVGDRSGPGAARVVALVIAELLTTGPEPAAEPAAPGVVAAAPARPDAHVAAIAVEAEPPADAGRPGTWAERLSVTAGVSNGTNSGELLAGTLDAELVVVLPWKGLGLYPSAGLTAMPTRNAGTAEAVSFYGGAARLLGGAKVGLLDLGAGPVVSPYSIGGAVLHAGVLLGGEAMARLTVPLWDRLRLCAGLRADLFANRVRVLFVDGGAYATPRVQLGLGLGVAWDWAS